MVTMVTRAPYRWIITADSAEVERLRALHLLPQPAPLDRRRHPDRHLDGQGVRGSPCVFAMIVAQLVTQAPNMAAVSY